MDKIKEKNQRQSRRHARVRAKVSGTEARPRLSVYRSNRGMALQLIDDNSGVTLASATMTEIKPAAGEGKIIASKKLGSLIADKAKAKKISQAVFDRGFYKYHGRVKAAAEGAREGGLKF
jgi:large subunit ribosomal protein L18